MKNLVQWTKFSDERAAKAAPSGPGRGLIQTVIPGEHRSIAAMRGKGTQAHKPVWSNHLDPLPSRLVAARRG